MLLKPQIQGVRASNMIQHTSNNSIEAPFGGGLQNQYEVNQSMMSSMQLSVMDTPRGGNSRFQEQEASFLNDDSFYGYDTTRQ